jgi:hypothetical protein
MPEFTQGVCEDGASILIDGVPMTIEEVIEALSALDMLVTLKRIKDDPVYKTWYEKHKPAAWDKARQALAL